LRLSDAVFDAITIRDMGPIPQRIAPLTWRKPAFIWTPLALALAIGGPAALFYADPALQRLAGVMGAAVFALALITLGASWMLGRPPRVRRVVVVHVVTAGGLVALITPFVLIELLALVADYERQGAGDGFTFAMSMAMTPLALVIALPVSLLSGIVFAWVALKRGDPSASDLVADDRFDVQPFR
jgi:hypothetical protein